jgi:hypothetical protein
MVIDTATVVVGVACSFIANVLYDLTRLSWKWLKQKKSEFGTIQGIDFVLRDEEPEKQVSDDDSG